MKCRACGHRVQRRDKFCGRCGAVVVPRVNASAAAPTNPRWPLLVALVTGGVLLGAVLVYFLMEKNTPAKVSAFDGRLHGVELAQKFPAVYEVASRFICPCGTCTDGLEVCDCGMPRGSTEVRTKIYELLAQHHVPHVVEIIAAEYGYRKNTVTPPSTMPSQVIPWERPHEGSNKD